LDKFNCKRHKKLQQEQLNKELKKLKSYISNRNIGMTREQYLDMCQEIGSEPIEDEIPVEVDDLTVQSQQVIEIFNYLPDEWGSMGGYQGKKLDNFPIIFELFEVPKTNWILYLDLLGVLIEEQVKIVNKKIEAESKRGAK